MSKWSRLTALALAMALAAGLRLWGIHLGLPHDLARPDEEKIAGAALGIAHGDLDPHFFLYPSLFIYVAAAAFRVWLWLEGPADTSSLHLIQRALAAACGIATIPVLYLAAKELFANRVSLIAAAFLAVAFLHVRDSHFGVTDVPVTLLIVCAFWAALRCATRGVTPARIAATGALCGLAASTKYNAALVAAPAVVALATVVFKRDEGRARTVSVALLLLVGCAALGFVAGTPFALLDRETFTADFLAQSRTGLGLQHGSILDPARAVYGGERGWFHHLAFSLRYGLGLPLLGAAIAGAGWLVLRRPAAAALVLSFPLAYYAAMGGSLLVYARWMVPVVPFLCLTAAVCVAQLAQSATRAFGQGRAAAAVAGVLTFLVAAPTAARSIAFDRLVAKPDSRVLAARWIQDRFPEGASVYQTGIFYGYVQPRPSGRYPAYLFDARRGFVGGSASAGVRPDVVVVLDSPLRMYNHIDERLPPILDSDYVWAATFRGIPSDPASEPAFDQQDAFYVPFHDFARAERAGPSIRIFLRAASGR